MFVRISTLTFSSPTIFDGLRGSKTQNHRLLSYLPSKFESVYFHNVFSTILKEAKKKQIPSKMHPCFLMAGVEENQQKKIALIHCKSHTKKQIEKRDFDICFVFVCFQWPAWEQTQKPAD